eukprot:4744090-Prymnesium_polylepis.1
MEAQSNSTVGGDPEPKRGSEKRRPINRGKLLRKRACPPLDVGRRSSNHDTPRPSPTATPVTHRGARRAQPRGPRAGQSGSQYVHHFCDFFKTLSGQRDRRGGPPLDGPFQIRRAFG